MAMNRLTLAATALWMTAGAAAAQATPAVVRIQDYPGIGNMLFRIAASKGYCEKHGIKCELQMIPSGPLGVQALLAKSIDVAEPPPEVVINASLKGSAIRIIAAAARLNVFLIVARNELGLPTDNADFKAVVAGLKGRKIGVPARGSGAELQFSLLAQKAGFKPEDFTYVAVGAPNTSYGALISKQIDASMTFEPSASLCDVTAECKTVYRGATASEPAEISRTNGASGVLVARQEMIDGAPDVIDGLLGAAKDAEDFLQNPANFPEALKIARSYFEFKMPRGDEVMEVSLKKAIPSLRVDLSRDALKQIADNMLAMGQLQAPFDTARILYPKAP